MKTYINILSDKRKNIAFDGPASVSYLYSIYNNAIESNDKNKPLKLKVKKGKFHEWLGKSPDQEITDADIEKGLKSKDPHVRKMAQFAKNAKKWKHNKGQKNKVSKESFTGISLEELFTEDNTEVSINYNKVKVSDIDIVNKEELNYIIYTVSYLDINQVDIDYVNNIIHTKPEYVQICILATNQPLSSSRDNEYYHVLRTIVENSNGYIYDNLNELMCTLL